MLARLAPREVLVPPVMLCRLAPYLSTGRSSRSASAGSSTSPLGREDLARQFGVQGLDGLGLETPG